MHVIDGLGRLEANRGGIQPLRGRQEIVESSLAYWLRWDSQATNRCRSLFECLILRPSIIGTPNCRRILMREGAGCLLRRRRVLRVMVELPRFRGRPALRRAQS